MPVDVPGTQDVGWPPLLYADFQAKEDCVLALIQHSPQQLFFVTRLMRESNTVRGAKKDADTARKGVGECRGKSSSGRLMEGRHAVSSGRWTSPYSLTDS